MHNDSKPDIVLDKKLNLILHSVMPDKEVAWEAGFDAAISELDLEENPFIEADDEYSAWEAGWWAGFYNEANLVKDVATSAQAKHIAERISKNAINKNTVDTGVILAQKHAKLKKHKQKIKVAAFSLSAAVAGLLAYAYFLEAFAA